MPKAVRFGPVVRIITEPRFIFVSRRWWVGDGTWGSIVGASSILRAPTRDPPLAANGDPQAVRMAFGLMGKRVLAMAFGSCS